MSQPSESSHSAPLPLGLQRIGRGPSTLRRAVCRHTQSVGSNAGLTRKRLQTRTEATSSHTSGCPMVSCRTSISLTWPVSPLSVHSPP